LVRVVGVFDGEVVQSELLLHLAQDVLLGLVQSEPHELIVSRQRRPDLLDAKVGHSRSAAVGGAIDDRGRGRRRWRCEGVGHHVSLRSNGPVSQAVDNLQPEAVACLQPMDQNPSAARLVLLQGTLDMLILQTLQWGAQHGYAITQMIRARSSEALQVETGSLYPALHRLQKQKWLKSSWDLTETNQRAKFYTLTPAGKKQLLRERDRWAQL